MLMKKHFLQDATSILSAAPGTDRGLFRHTTVACSAQYRVVLTIHAPLHPTTWLAVDPSERAGDIKDMEEGAARKRQYRKASGKKSEQASRQKQLADSREEDDEKIDCVFPAS